VVDAVSAKAARFDLSRFLAIPFSLIGTFCRYVDVWGVSLNNLSFFYFIYGLVLAIGYCGG